MRTLLYDERGEPLVLRDDEHEQNLVVGGEDALDAMEPRAAVPLTFELPVRVPMPWQSYDPLELDQIKAYEAFDITMPDGSKPRRRIARGSFDFEPGEGVIVAMTFDVKPVESRETLANTEQKRETLRRLSPSAAEREREAREAKKRETLRRLQTPAPEDDVAKDIRYMLDGIHRRDVL